MCLGLTNVRNDRTRGTMSVSGGGGGWTARPSDTGLPRVQHCNPTRKSPARDSRKDPALAGLGDVSLPAVQSWGSSFTSEAP
jgi:hypothetical protein